MSDKIPVKKVIVRPSDSTSAVLIDLERTTAKTNNVDTDKKFYTAQGALAEGSRDIKIRGVNRSTDTSTLYVRSAGVYSAENYEGVSGWSKVDVRIPELEDLDPTSASKNDLLYGSTAYSKKHGFIEGAILPFPNGDIEKEYRPAEYSLDTESLNNKKIKQVILKEEDGIVLSTEARYSPQNIWIYPQLETILATDERVSLSDKEDKMITADKNNYAGIKEITIPKVQAKEETFYSSYKDETYKPDTNTYFSSITVKGVQKDKIAQLEYTPQSKDEKTFYPNDPEYGKEGAWFFDEVQFNPPASKKYVYNPSSFDDWYNGEKKDPQTEENNLYYNEVEIAPLPKDFVVLKSETEILPIEANGIIQDVREYQYASINVPVGHKANPTSFTPDGTGWHGEIKAENGQTVYWDVTVEPVPLYKENDEIAKDYNYDFLYHKGEEDPYPYPLKTREALVNVLGYSHILIDGDPLAGTTVEIDGLEHATEQQLLKGHVAWASGQELHGAIETYAGEKTNPDENNIKNVLELSLNSPVGEVFQTKHRYCDKDVLITPRLADWEVEYGVTTTTDTNGKEILVKQDSITWTIEQYNADHAIPCGGLGTVTINLSDAYQVVQGNKLITTNVNEEPIGSYATVTVRIDAALPTTVASETDMENLLKGWIDEEGTQRNGTVGGIYQYTGTTGKYEYGELYILEESDV